MSSSRQSRFDPEKKNLLPSTFALLAWFGGSCFCPISFSRWLPERFVHAGAAAGQVAIFTHTHPTRLPALNQAGSKADHQAVHGKCFQLPNGRAGHNSKQARFS
ncbi:MAG: hypothetical protein JO356_09455 [Acidobacteria bacterium]|nr:hypothetical protein [Acidobacteriota bacterium]